jgi:peroxiredoxin
VSRAEAGPAAAPGGRVAARGSRPRATSAPTHRLGRTVRPGDVVRARTLDGLDGRVELPRREGLVHLQLRRFAGCPVCNLHLATFVRRHGELVDAGVHEVVVFHSSTAALRRHAAGLPFAVVADPAKALYREFGVEARRRALLDPRAWPAIVRGVARSTWEVVRRRRRFPPVRPDGGRFGLPADILVGPDGRVVAAHYGAHADDQWSVDEVLRIAEGATGPRSVSNRGEEQDVASAPDG